VIACARVAGAPRRANILSIPLIAVVLCACGVRPAHADPSWFFMPSFGAAFGAETTIVDPAIASGLRKNTYAAAVGLLGPGVFGAEVEVTYTPDFFQRSGRPGLVTSSSVATAMGNVVIATPLRWTGYSLRPYASGGIGLMRSRSRDTLDLLPVTKNLAAFNVGAGATGFFSDGTGVRLDVRFFRSITSEEDTGQAFGPPMLRFWRASLALVVRL
jgi:hypothetical protein